MCSCCYLRPPFEYNTVVVLITVEVYLDSCLAGFMFDTRPQWQYDAYARSLCINACVLLWCAFQRIWERTFHL
jgi:hypothetical protein